MTKLYITVINETTGKEISDADIKLYKNNEVIRDSINSYWNVEPGEYRIDVTVNEGHNIYTEYIEINDEPDYCVTVYVTVSEVIS